MNIIFLSEILKHYDIHATITFSGSGAYYDFNTNVINLPEYSLSDTHTVIMSLLHEISHAIDAKYMGVDILSDAYQHASEESMLHTGHDPFDANVFELQADIFAEREYPKWKENFKESENK